MKLEHITETLLKTGKMTNGEKYLGWKCEKKLKSSKRKEVWCMDYLSSLLEWQGSYINGTDRKGKI